MIAADTSSFIYFLHNPQDPSNAPLLAAIRAQSLRFPPPVKTELLSKPVTGEGTEGYIESAPLLPISSGYWERAGHSRQLIWSKGLRARLADTLIAQACIDADVSLIARDTDFRHFQKWCGLRLA